ncbi:MAG: hypothetical protein ACI9DQ_001395, partial [Glaciecola sp.]
AEPAAARMKPNFEPNCSLEPLIINPSFYCCFYDVQSIILTVSLQKVLSLTQ